MVVIGNPPYSGHSANRSWEIKEGKRVPTFIGKLLQDYYQVDGRPLGEKNPKWLQDDYVKFIRFGQWRIQETGEGILALITNHSYLDNPTFRGMRQQLMQAFTDIYLLDLHGNAKKKERAPDGGRDDNVFDIQQGVAIALFVKDPSGAGPARVLHADLWGTREAKCKPLSENTCETIPWRELHPTSPSYLFVPQDTALLPEYAQARCVTAIFSVFASTVTTARNHFAMAYDPETLLSRIRTLQDQSLDDQTLRDRYHLRDVSYWKLRRAREQLSGIGDPAQFIRPYCYRPFDSRFVFYHPAICERLRPEVMRHMAAPNTALLTHRPQSPGDFTFAYCTSMIGDQCVAANKTVGGGNSFQFPLYLYPDPGLPGLGGTGFQPVRAGCKPAPPAATAPRENTIDDNLRITRRNLPHWQAGGSSYFITFRLKGSTGFQPVPLLSPQERRLVKEAILFWHTKKWTVHALTVMPDHVHILATPMEQSPGHWLSLSSITHGVKRHSAREINRLRGSRGPLWQSECFDRIIRHEKEFGEKFDYILGNASKAGLADDGWSYDGFWCEADGEQARELAASATGRQPNLNPQFVAELQQQLPLRFVPDGQGELSTTFGPEDVFAYIYAILHCPTYRSRYAQFLKRDFPRIPFTSNRDLFAALAAKGRDLVALHLMESPLLDALITSFPEPGSDKVERVAYNDNQRRVYINKVQYFDGVPKAVWDFQVGGYQVCHKWLKDRKGRALTFDDLQHYQKIVVALHETIRLMAETDALIPSWPIT